MSAYIVSRNHIAYLVNAALRPKYHDHGGLSWVWGVDRESGQYQRGTLPISDYKRAAEVAQMLWDENGASVAYRYPDSAELPCTLEDEASGFEYGEHESSSAPYSPVATLKALDGYEYQSCEHPGWEGSQAKAFCNALRSRCISDLPGYDEAEWSV